MKILKKLGILCLSILVLSGCGKKEDTPDNPTPTPPTPNPTPQTEVVKTQSVTIELPQEVDQKVAEELVVSNAYGDFRLVELPAESKPSPTGRGEVGHRVKLGANIEYAGLGLLLNNVLDKQGNVLMCSITNPHSLREIAINARETAIALLMLRPELITNNKEEFQKAVEIIVTLPEFKEYNKQIEKELVESIKAKRTPNYQKLNGDNAVLRALLGKTMANPSYPDSQLEITRGSMKKKDGVFNFTITNNLKRILHIYPKKVYMQDNGLVVKKEEYLTRDLFGVSVPQMSVITPAKANYWKIVYGSLIEGDKSSIFKTTSAGITANIGDADKLKLEIYGIGKLDKPFSQYTDEQKTRILFVFVHGAYNDFVKPGIDLAFGIEDVANASGTDDIAYDFRYGSKKHPETLLFNTAYSAYSRMISNLTLSLISDTQLMGDLAKDFDNKEYLAMTYRIGKFIVSEFYDELQKEIFSEGNPNSKAKYLNSLYDIFKQVSGVSKTSEDFRKGLKTFTNQLTHVAKVNFAAKVIKMSELAVDVAGAIYAYFSSDVISTVIEDRADAPYFTLLAPKAGEQFKDNKNITFKWDFFQGNFRALGDYMKIDLVIECQKRDGTYAVETISDLSYNTREKAVNLDAYPAFKTLYIFRWKVVARHRLNSNMRVESAYSSFNTKELPPLALSADAVTMKKGETVQVTITSGTGSYTLTTSNAYIATAALSKANLITITGKGKGIAVITITDEESGEKQTITANVKSNATDIPDGVVIENGVLKKWPCDKIPIDGKVVIPSTVTEIGEKAFQDCRELSAIEIPTSVSKIGNYAFWDCTALKNVVIPNSVEIIKQNAFIGCTALENITIPGSVKTIEKAAFYNCSSLTNLTLTNGIRNIGDAAFENCSSLTKVVVPNSVRNMGESVFEGCSALESVKLSENVATIPYQTFYNCYSLKNVEFSSSLTIVELGAFVNCKSLTAITFPKTIKRIFNGSSYNPFDGCTNLKTVNIKATVPFSIGSVFVGNKAVVYVPEITLEVYQSYNSSYKDRIKALKGDSFNGNGGTSGGGGAGD